MTLMKEQIATSVIAERLTAAILTKTTTPTKRNGTRRMVVKTTATVATITTRHQTFKTMATTATVTLNRNQRAVSADATSRAKRKETTKVSTPRATASEEALKDSPFYKPKGHKFDVKGAHKVHPGVCAAKNCNEIRGIKATGEISPCCSGKCFGDWDRDGRPAPEQICAICCEEGHSALKCKHITLQKKKEMIEKIGYNDTARWWFNVNNIAKAQRFLKVIPAKQLAMRESTEDGATGHGVAWIAGIMRRVYFDLGGEFNLLDRLALRQLCLELAKGHYAIKRITPEEMGYTSKGVPIDVACATGAEKASVVWVTEWYVVTITIITDEGRKL